MGREHEELDISKFVAGVESIYDQLPIGKKKELKENYAIDCSTELIKSMLSELDIYIDGMDFYDMY